MKAKVKTKKKWKLNPEWVKLGPKADIHFLYAKPGLSKILIKSGVATNKR